jgi:hypothetical protein
VVFNPTKTGKGSFRVKFSEPEFAKIQRVCNQAPLTLEEFFQVAIGTQIANLEAKPKTQTPISVHREPSSRAVSLHPFAAYDELELAVKQSQALNVLLCEAVNTRRESVYSDYIQTGIIELTGATHGRLGRAVDTMTAQFTAHTNPEKAAL